VKIAFVALPRHEDTHISRIAPPLPLGYVAAMLEQRRHIVRIYDLALFQDSPLSSALAPLRLFRPHLVVLASDHPGLASNIEAALQEINTKVIRLGTSLREGAIAQAVTRALWYVDEQSAHLDEQSVIFEALLALDDDLDALPFPARHLLPLEQYPLFTLKGDLQTTVLIAQQISSTYAALRQPQHLITEIQSVMREHGIRHFVFAGTSITRDPQWIRDLTYYLSSSGLGIAWEATVGHEDLTPELLLQLRQAGCEALCFEFLAGDVLVSRDTREPLSSAAIQARNAGFGVRAHIHLDPPFSAMPSLIDVSATVGLDAVHFHIQRDAHAERDRVGLDGVSLDDIAEMARTRYRSSRSRQFFVDRFGPQLGPMLWRVGRAGLLGRTWQQYADGGDEGVLAY
jgi:hypothetical protein